MGFFASSGILNRKGFFGGVVGFDADAEAFFSTAGITDSTAKTQINDFVLGIKNLGLYSSMISWPLRSSQNAGTGTTAYSLGGLATNNGTLVNTPTWGTDGIVFSSASSQYITTTYRFPSGQLWIFADVDLTNTSTNYAIVTKDNQSASRDWAVFYSTATARIRLDANIGGGIGNRISLPNSQTTDRQTVQFSHNGTDYNARRNRETRQTASGTGTITDNNVNVRIGAFGSGLFPLNGTLGSVILFNTAPSATQETDLYDLYKMTIGQGLGLP